MVGLHLNDAALVLARDGIVVSSVPSIVNAETTAAERLGTSASELVRYRPLAVSTRHWDELARAGAASRMNTRVIVRAELAHRLAVIDPRSALQIAVPATFTAETCGEVLGGLRELDWTVHGFHDAAALIAVACGIDKAAVVLEVGLHHVAASAVTMPARRRAVSIRHDSGLLALQEAWLDLVSESMVRRSRFDPLHDAADEQRVFDSVMAWARTAAREGTVDIDWPTPTGSIRITLSRDAFAAAAAPVYRDILAVIHELRPAGSAIELLLPECVRDWPGMCEALDDVRATRCYTFTAELAARAASMLSVDSAPGRAAEGRVMLRRGVDDLPQIEIPRPWSDDGGDAGTSRKAVARRPSHAIFGERAYPLVPGTILGIGRMPGPKGLILPDDARGVSRLHCTLRVVDEGVELVDHSRYGTWVNDERVVRRVRLVAGDRIRVGDPGLVISLLAAGEAHGSSP